MKIISVGLVLIIMALSCQATISSRLYLAHKAELSLKRFLDYIDHWGVGNMPLDTTFCLRGIEGLLKNVKPKLAKKARYLAMKDRKLQKKLHPSYFRSFHKMIDKYLTPKAPLQTTSYVKNSWKVKKCDFDEDKSDVCLTQALNCQAQGSCLKGLEADDKGLFQSDYCLTHQMIYYNLLRKHHCPNLDSKITKMAEEKIQTLANVLYEEKEKKFNGKWSDVWVERNLLGIMVGDYDRFVQERVVRKILSYQRKKGCWPSEDELDMDDDETRTMIDYSSRDGCAYHTTGLAAYYLAGYVYHTKEMGH